MPWKATLLVVTFGKSKREKAHHLKEELFDSSGRSEKETFCKFLRTLLERNLTEPTQPSPFHKKQWKSSELSPLQRQT